MWPVWAELHLFGRPLLFTGYGVFAILGAALGTYLTVRSARRLAFPEFDAFAAAVLGIAAGFVGAKLLFLLVSLPELLRDGAGPLLAGGGLVWYGGVLGGALGAWLYLRAYGLNPLRFADLAVPGLAVGHALGRVGCVMAGCCYGKPTTLPWALHYPETPYFRGDASLGRHPVQLYEAAFELVLAAVAWRIVRKLPRGLTFAGWAALYSAGRVILELFFRDDDRGAGIFGLPPSAALGLLAVLGAGATLVARGVNLTSNPKAS